VKISPIGYTWSGDFAIGYQTVGEGPIDLVYLAPWASNLDWNWRWDHHARFLRRLGSFSRLILFDPRGWGVSDRHPPGSTPTLDDLVADMTAVLDTLNIGSAAGLTNIPFFPTYSASKAATHSLTQVTRAMLRGQHTQVFGVYPGPIDTKMGEALPLEKASPADAARAIVAGIIAGDEEIFPDKMSQGTGPAFFADPKGLERQVAGVPTAA